MRKIHLIFLFITLFLLMGCESTKAEKLCRIEIQNPDGETIKTLDNQSQADITHFFNDGEWNMSANSDQELTPQYIIDIYQKKTRTKIPSKDSDTYEKILTYTTYEDSDIVQVIVSKDTIHNQFLSDDELTFYYIGTDNFFSSLNDALK